MEKKQECPKGAPAWMVSFSDMTTLLLVFFVMMLASGEVPEQEMRIIMSAFSGTLGVLSGGHSISEGRFENMGQEIERLPSATRGKMLSKSLKRAVSVFKPQITARQVRVTEDERGIVISLLNDVLFKPASAELDYEAARPMLENIRLLLSGLDSKVRIEGHTDATPLEGSSAFKDNWELSSARAWAILHGLLSVPSQVGIDESQLSISGYGSTRPVENNDTPEGRAYNRRVDIIILRENS
ncbi:MAG TPA: flagellar motor protein MotB [Spirochaetia bacterium]|nr:flagellar motor protein MotB [Spirochaetia bacterium]